MIYTFDSSMLGAPVLSGTAGALRGVLKACLVDGFGAGAVATLTVTGGVATATFAGAHPHKVGAVAQIDGATPAGLNGPKRVLSTAADRVTFEATGVPDGAATGSITHKVAAAGWQELFPAALTNVLALKPSAVEATGCVLRVDDTGGTNARVIAYESMADIATGQGATPLESQASGGLWWPKSASANATARPWVLLADDRAIYLAVAPNGSDRYTLLFAGDISSFKSGDAYGYLLTGNQGDQTAATTVPDGCCGYSHRSARVGAYLVRAHTAVGQSLAAQRLGAHHNGPAADVYAGAAGYSLGTYPNGPNNGLLTGVLEVHALGIRGVLPGLLHPVQDTAGTFATGAIIPGTDHLQGRSLLAVRTSPPAGAAVGGTVLLDITGLWER